MELSYFLAQLMGLSLAIFAAIGIYRPSIVRKAVDAVDDNSLLTILYGFMGIVVGLAIVLSHNIWEWSWVGLITLFGWTALLKGITYLAAPNILLGMGNAVYKNHSSIRMALLGGVLLGLYLAYKGFGN